MHFRHWDSTRTLLGQYSNATGTVLERYWDSTQTLLGIYFSAIGDLLYVLLGIHFYAIGDSLEFVPNDMNDGVGNR